MLYNTYFSSPLGKIMLTGNDESLTGLWIAGQKYFAGTAQTLPLLKNDLPLFAETKKWLQDYFLCKRPSIDNLPLAPQGGEFRQSVWKILREIPYGSLTTYGEIAREIARQNGKTKMSAQAVGGAVGHNPISIIIPCHRVVGTNGSLTGYAGGLDLKIKLLELEGVDMSKLFRPNKGTAL